MFIEEFQDRLDGYISKSDLYIMGDVNLHFDSNKDMYAVTMKALSNRNLDELVNVPTHKKGHILDCLVTNSPKHTAALPVDDKCISDHLISPFHGLMSSQT